VFRRSPDARTTRASQRPANFASGPRAAQAREVFRLAPPVVLWWVWLAFVAANVADFAVQGVHGASARSVLVVAAILATVTGLTYALALRPRVIADQAGLTITNPFRDHHVPWGAIQMVAADDWVRVYYAPDQDAAGVQSSANAKSIACWALYVSVRAKRKEARPPRPQGGSLPSLLGFQGLSRRASLPAGLDEEPGYGQGSRLPEQAKYLASLPVTRAMAVRLDTRADKERARAAPSAPPGPVTARWAWIPLAAVAVPALALLIIALA
jgi:Bacterial PH domain